MLHCVVTFVLSHPLFMICAHA